MNTEEKEELFNMFNELKNKLTELSLDETNKISKYGLVTATEHLEQIFQDLSSLLD